jgi:hypothetical protein
LHKVVEENITIFNACFLVASLQILLQILTSVRPFAWFMNLDHIKLECGENLCFPYLPSKLKKAILLKDSFPMPQTKCGKKLSLASSEERD